MTDGEMIKPVSQNVVQFGAETERTFGGKSSIGPSFLGWVHLFQPPRTKMRCASRRLVLAAL